MTITSSKFKRLYRSKDSIVLTGLLGGIAEYFTIDPVVVRLGFILITAFTGFGPGLIAYIVGSIMVPVKQK